MDRNSQDAKSKQYMKKFSIGTLLTRGYEVNCARGEIYGPSGKRIDKLQIFRGSTYNPNTHKYKQIQVSTVDGTVKLSAHIVIWAAHHGRWPLDDHEIDHINNDRHDNRIENLRELPRTENRQLGQVYKNSL